ncbi:WD40/YVTN/BNR-like repeat-containing protein [Labilithrix luteola]|nr:hypothetical protein [Labilithrix luteola]
MQRWLATGMMALAPLCITRGAIANGRFPQAQIIETVPGSAGETVFLRTTFGILVSRDAGKSWRWICERALGYEGTWDPPIAVMRDGRLWVGLEGGLVSTLDGCVVERAPELEGETIADLTTDPHGEMLWAITGSPEKRNAIWRREPTGAWRRMGFAPENVHLMTIEVAPSRTSRLYVTGQPYGEVRGQVFHSDDGGKTLHAHANALSESGPLFIAAVDPSEPSRVLLRHLHAAGSALLVTSDAGKTLSPVLEMKSAMFGFAKSTDGRTYWAGSGLPEHGIYRSTDRGKHFERVSEHGVLCLHEAPGNRLFVCENGFKLGAPAVGLSTDEGSTVRAIASFGDVEGPVACAAEGAAASLCADAWPETRALVLPREAGAPKPVVEAGVSNDAGTQAPPPRKSACGCSTIGERRETGGRWWLVGLVPLAQWMRRSRRSGSAGPHPGQRCTR